MYIQLYEDCRDEAVKPMTYFERLFDIFLDRLIIISDYFILTKKISLTEMAIWWLSVSRTIWLMFVEVESPYNMMMENGTWLWIYLTTTAIHTVTFFLTQKARAFAVCLQGFVWCMLGWLAVMSHSRSFTLPTVIVLTLASVAVAVKLFRDKEWKQKNCS